MTTILRTILAFLLAIPPALAAEGVAFFSDLKGEVAVDGNARPNLLSELSKGQKINVGRDSQASVMFTATGKEYLLKGPGDYTVKDTEIGGAIMPPASRSTDWRASPKVLAQVAQTSAASVRMRSIAKPKEDPNARATFPAEGNVATLQPVFRWRADDARSPVEFALHVVGQEKPVHLAKAVAGGNYRVPGKLKPDTEYVWTATSAGAEVGAGKFRTLSGDALARVEKRRPAERSEFSDRLLFTLLLQEMGATQEARESWARLAQERADLPELSALAR
jgi:hypothetical protein